MKSVFRIEKGGHERGEENRFALCLFLLTDEEDHEASVELVGEQPLEPRRRPVGGVAVDVVEGVDVGHDGDDEDDLGHPEELRQLHPPGGCGEVVPFDRELRVFLLQ